jgi:hypothetical protein
MVNVSSGGPYRSKQAASCLPSATRILWATRNTRGHRLQLHSYPDVNHQAIVGPGGTDALAWTIDRFNNSPPTENCPAG